MPSLNEISVWVNRTVPLIRQFIIETCKHSEGEAYIIHDKAFYNLFCDMDPIIDKILAFILIDIFSEQETFKNENELNKVWYKVMAQMKTSGDEESNPFELVEPIEVHKLNIGMTISNYRVLCALLGQPTKTGNSKKAQLDNFKRYFDWEKSGQKFIITDIYDTPLTKEDRRKLGNNSIYVQCIEVILLQYLSKQNEYTRTFTKKNWWELLGIVNHKFGRISEKQLKELDYSITSFEIKHFYQRCNKKLEQILFSALNSLKNRKLVIYELQTVIVEHDDGGKEKYFLASDNDKKKILQIERHVLHNIMGFEKMIQVFARFKQSEFYQKVNELLYQYYGWNHYFKQIKIIYTPEDIREALPKAKLDLQKELLNQKVIDFLNTNAQEVYKKKNEEYKENCKKYFEDWWGEKECSSKPWKIPDTYLTAQKILTNELIRIGHKDIAFSMEDFIESNTDLDDLFSFGL